MSTPPRVVVVGASIGGLTAAETLRQEGYDGEIVLVGDEACLPYTRPPLSKQVLMGEWEPERAAVRSAAEIHELDIEVRTGCPAIGLDVAGRVLHTARGPLQYDELVVATGSSPRSYPLLPEALTLRTLSDAIALRDALRAVSNMAVVGAGILGAEIASAARKYGVEATLVGREDRLCFGSVGTLLSDRLAELHAAHDVEVLLNTEVRDADSAPGRTTLTFGDGVVRSFDLVVVMIGARPNTRWLESSTVPLGDGVLCDSTGTAAPGVHAVGDVAAWADPATGRHARVEHQSNAIEQAVGVASRIVHGAPAEPPVPLFWSEIHGTRINAYGWFDSARPLSGDATATVLTSRDAEDHVRGVVGWNATPREFRVARAAVSRPSSPQPSRPTDPVESAVHVEGATR